MLVQNQHNKLILYFPFLIATANAASIMMNKRAAQNVELCVKSINDISTQIGVLQPTVNITFFSIAIPKNLIFFFNY